MLLKRFLLLLILLVAVPITAQDDDDEDNGFTDAIINYDMTLADTIDEVNFFDLYRFNGTEGEVIVITVEAADGLAPLIGLLDPVRELVAVSEDGAVNGRVELEYTIAQSGEHVINMTRVGNESGDTTGSYTLTLRRASAGDQAQPDLLQDVTFRCRDVEVTTAATIDFSQFPGEAYVFNLYAFGDFQPVLRLELDTMNFQSQCSQDSSRLGGHEIVLPGGESLLLEDEQPSNAAQFGVSSDDSITRVVLTVGSVEGAAGRWVLVMDGFSLDNAGSVDQVAFRIGPLAAADSDLTVYMIADTTTRLDPLIEVFSTLNIDTVARLCDDAGLRECAEVIPADDLLVDMGEDGTITGDRFDAGVILAPGDITEQLLAFRSRAVNATGDYAIIIIGELPSRE